MLNLIPHFIHEKLKYSYRLREGSFPAATISVDIVGFTFLTEKLMKKGKSGAEELSVLINRVYGPLINFVYKNGGFVANFTGDAITGIFPNDTGHNALNTALSIRKNFENRRNYYRRFSGGEEINAQIGLSSGDVSWRIIGEARKTYCFFGDPIYECASVTTGKDIEIIAISKQLINSLRDQKRRIVIGEQIIDHKPLTRITRNIVKQFVPNSVVMADYGGEFRSVTSVFIAFKWSDNPNETDDLVNDILSKCDEFGGYFNGMFYDDKGPHILVVFGAPVSYENNTDRALDFTCGLREKYGRRFKAGITSGTVFAGAVGNRRRCTYTVLGDAVNMAARVMQSAEWGRVRISGSVVDRVSAKYDTEDIGKKSLKGKAEPVTIFDVKGTIETHIGEMFEGEMVGRDDELELLQAHCKPIFKSNFGGVAYVYGEAGIGKSRLVYELTNQTPDNTQILMMQTDEILRKSFNPFAYLLKKYFDQTDSASDDANETIFENKWDGLIERLGTLADKDKVNPVINEMERTKSLIAALLGHHSEGSLYDELNAKSKFNNTIIALKEFFKAQSLLAPTILVLEDMHWLDVDSKAVFQSLTRNVADFPFIIIAPSRFNDDGSKPQLTLDEDTLINELVIKSLSSDAETGLIEKRLCSEVGSELASFIIERTEGNPFYVEQFCRYLQENQLLDMKSDVYQLIKSDFDIPRGINAIIVARVDRLSRKLKELVQTASVLGREFDVQILSAMLRGEMDNLESLLVQGESEALWQALSEISFIFKHALLCDVIYDMQLGKRLSELHKLAAEAMENLYEDDKTRYADIAYHYEKSEIKDKAVEYLKKAAEFARNDYRNVEALALYNSLKELLDTDEEITEVEFEIADLLELLGRWDETKVILQNIISEWEKKSYDSILAKGYLKMGRIYLKQVEHDKSAEALNIAKKLYEKHNDIEGMGRVIGELGNIEVNHGNYEKALSYFNKWLNIAKELGLESGIANAYGQIGLTNYYLGNLDESLSFYNRELEICNKLNDKAGSIKTLGNIGGVYFYKQDFETAISYVEEQIEFSIEIGDKSTAGHSLSNIGACFIETNRYEEAETKLLTALTLSKEINDIKTLLLIYGNLGEIKSDMGYYDEALDLYGKTLALAEEIGYKLYIGLSLSSVGAIQVKKRKYNEARELYAKAEALYEQIGNPFHLCGFLFQKADLGYLTEETEDVPALLKRAMELAEESGRDDITFRCEMLEAKIGGETDKEATVKSMVDLKEKYDSDENQAEIYYELYRLTNELPYHKNAIALYTKLAEGVPKAEYREKLEELK